MRPALLKSIAAFSVTAAVLTLLSMRSTEQEKAPPGKAPEVAKTAKASPTTARFKEEWKEVRAKYPTVAAAYLESLEYVLDSDVLPRRAAQRRQFALLSERLADLGIRLPCRWVCETTDGADEESEREPIEPCRLCPPARNDEDIERYLACLEERIECLH